MEHHLASCAIVFQHAEIKALAGLQAQCCHPCLLCPRGSHPVADPMPCSSSPIPDQEL